MTTIQMNQQAYRLNVPARAATTAEINLSVDDLWSFQNNTRGTNITCLEGAVWVTQEGDLRDHILEPGEQFTINRPGEVVAQGLFKSTIRVSQPLTR